eukprot:scaffold2679_cov251-Pinguiococcus_pyrenoidosus.AAC.10
MGSGLLGGRPRKRDTASAFSSCLLLLPFRKTYLGKIQTIVLHAHSVRPRDRVEKRQAHVGPSKLGDDGGVLALDAGVHDALRVHHHLDVVVARTEEVVRLDHLQTLVHHGG